MSNRFKPYPDYQNTELDWLGRVPKSWELRRLGSYFRERREKVSDSDFPALSVTMQGIVPQLENAAKTSDGDNRKLVRKGDFAINSRSDRKGSSGVSAYDGSVSLITIVLQPKGLHPAYVHHLLRSEAFQEEFYRFGKGIVADLWSTNFEAMKNITIPVMSLDEQTQIAAFLDYETAKIDALIEKQQQLIALLGEKRQAVISHAVTKGLNPDAPMRDSGIEWLGKVPTHWKAVRVRDVGKVDQGCAFAHAIQGQESGEIPWFKVNDMNRDGNEVEMRTADNYVALKLAESIRAPIFPAGTVIFPRVGAALLTNKRRILTSRAIIDDNVYGIRPHTVVPRFLLHFLSLVDMARLCSAGLVPTVTFSVIKEIRLPLPPQEEQNAIVDHIERLLAKLDLLEEKVANALGILQERRTALISAAVTGKIDVRGWKRPSSDARLGTELEVA